MSDIPLLRFRHHNHVPNTQHNRTWEYGQPTPSSPPQSNITITCPTRSTTTSRRIQPRAREYATSPSSPPQSNTHNACPTRSTTTSRRSTITCPTRSNHVPTQHNHVPNTQHNHVPTQHNHVPGNTVDCSRIDMSRPAAVTAVTRLPIDIAMQSVPAVSQLLCKQPQSRAQHAAQPCTWDGAQPVPEGRTITCREGLCTITCREGLCTITCLKCNRIRHHLHLLTSTVIAATLSSTLTTTTNLTATTTFASTVRTSRRRHHDYVRSHHRPSPPSLRSWPPSPCRHPHRMRRLLKRLSSRRMSSRSLFHRAVDGPGGGSGRGLAHARVRCASMHGHIPHPAGATAGHWKVAPSSRSSCLPSGVAAVERQLRGRTHAQCIEHRHPCGSHRLSKRPCVEPWRVDERHRLGCRRG